MFSQRFPQFLPDGRRFLFYAVGIEQTQGIYLSSLDGERTVRRLTAADVPGLYLAPGWLVFVRQGTLLAQRFDPDRVELLGDPIAVAQGISTTDLFVPPFSVAPGGVIAYRAGLGATSRLTWFDRAGRAAGVIGAPEDNNLLDPQFSPDGRRVAATRTVQNNTDIWLFDDAGGMRFTFDAATDKFPVWSPDGSRIIFAASRKGPSDLYEGPSDASSKEAPILETPSVKVPTDWSPDGRSVMYFEVSPRTSADLWILPVGGDSTSYRWLDTPSAQIWGQFSPNGRFVAYHSDESGRYEVYVRPFPGPGGQWKISAAGGVYARWARSGNDLYYIAPDSKLMAVPIEMNGATVNPGTPTALFQTRIVGGGGNVVGRRHQYDVARDGRFLINVETDSGPGAPITLLLNWKPAR